MKALCLCVAAMAVGCGVSEREPIDLAPTRTTCPEDGWCWVRGRPLTVGGGFSPGRVFAIGPDGEFLRWTDDGWFTQTVPTARMIVSALIVDPHEMWAADDEGSAWRFDGAAWARSPADWPIVRFLPTHDTAVWAVAGASAGAHGEISGGSLVRRDGDAWVRPMEPHPFCLGGDYAIVDGQPWTVGLTCVDGGVNAAEVRRFDGSSWVLVGEPIEGQGWFPSFTRSEQPVRFRGTGSFEWDGTAWRTAETAGYPQDLGPEETAIFDGIGYVRVDASTGCDQVFRADEESRWCAGSGRVFFEGSGGWLPTIADPFELTQPRARFDSLPATLYAGSDTAVAWAAAPDDVYRVRVSSGRAAEHFDGLAWRTVLAGTVYDVDGAASDDVWFTSEHGPVHWDGSTFEMLAIPAELGEHVERVAALGHGVAVFSAGDGLLLYDDGWSTLHRFDDGWVVTSIAGTSVSDLWIARHHPGRSNDVMLAHRVGATMIDVALVQVVGEIAVAGDRVFVRSEGMVTDSARDAPMLIGDFQWDAALSVTRDAVWLTTGSQALRHPLR